MATRGQKVRVGAFLLASGALAATAFAVSARLHATKSVDYFVRFDESVSGLSPGSEVRYRGVPVGSVDREPSAGMTNGRVQRESGDSSLSLRDVTT